MKYGLALAVAAISLLLDGGGLHAAPETSAPPPGWKPDILSDAEERRWIAAVEGRATADGATVIQVLQHAENLRPTRFKVASIAPFWTGAGGAPAGVGIGYWIGSKRLEGDAYGNLSFNVRRDGGSLVVSVAEDDRAPRTIVTALERGRDAFVAYVDQMYQDTCIDTETREKFC
ncbi:transcriptional regulator [Methylobacterium sp. J-026]|uniref:transcriptional regulator n=1 Tax=Methylobacterium sp. J-026 TaxID=2836624 RepID=UPI001FBAC027|nr:transcriptional regulator [Methylobacterium sp. J-026]MCJ2133299.1 transcriptional regulator [Methylobacterium sp. J-026]